MAMIDTLEKVLKPIGPSGRETAVADSIRNEVEPYADDIRVDALGNLIVTKYGKAEHPKKIMFSAHMDHIGYVVTCIEKEGYLRTTKVGGVSVTQSMTRHVTFENGVHGIVVSEPVKGNAEFRDLYIDIGAADREEAEKLVSVGDMAVYANDCFRMGEHRVASPAMDDRCACALLVELMKNLGETQNTVVCLFSVQEEVGTRGAKVAAFSEDPDIGIAVDVTAAGDTPNAMQLNMRLGEGVCVKFMDRGSISSPVLRDELLMLAEKNNIPVQREVLPFGGTDAGAMQLSRGGIPVCTLSIPCRNVHSACEVIDMRDMQGCLQLMLTYLG